MIHVIAEIEVRDGAREAFLEEFRRIVPAVREEEGCLEYGPTTEIETEVSQPLRPNVVTVIEKWSDESALQAHLKAPHMDEYRRRAGHMVANVAIRVYRPE